MIDRLKYYLVKDFIENPVFLVFMGRSGSTALFNALGELSTVLSGVKESPFTMSFGGMLNKHFIKNKDDNRYHFHRNTFPFDNYHFKRKAKLYLLENIIAKPYKYKTSGKKTWITGTFLSETELEAIKEIFPSAKIIYMHRNGLDQIISSRKKFPSYKKENFEFACEKWAHHFNVFKYLLDRDDTFVLSNDNLIGADKVPTVEKLLKFMNLNNEKDTVVNYLKNNIIHPHGEEDKKGDFESYLKTLKEKNISSLSDEEIKIFLKHCEYGMNMLGYSTNYLKK